MMAVLATHRRATSHVGRDVGQKSTKLWQRRTQMRTGRSGWTSLSPGMYFAALQSSLLTRAVCADTDFGACTIPFVQAVAKLLAPL